MDSVIPSKLELSLTGAKPFAAANMENPAHRIHAQKILYLLLITFNSLKG